jgi:hypothetical protein
VGRLGRERRLFHSAEDYSWQDGCPAILDRIPMVPGASMILPPQDGCRRALPTACLDLDRIGGALRLVRVQPNGLLAKAG